MKKYIFTILCVLFVGAGVCRADEIVLENGEIYSGNVLDLTENTVSIRVEDKKVVISRGEVHAVFLGEQTPFSSYGYPGLHAGNRNPQPSSPDVRKDVKDKK